MRNTKLNTKQLLLSNKFHTEKEFGGAHLKNSHAKKARPIPIKKAMHLTLRSSQAKGKKSFRLDKYRIQKIESVVRAQAKKFGVQIYRYANVGNHLHLLVQASYRKGFISFLRSISGIIARIVLGVERGNAKLSQISSSDRINKSDQTNRSDKMNNPNQLNCIKCIKNSFNSKATKFWDQRPWTRVLFTWTEFKNVKKYVEQNFNEAMGFVPYKPRKTLSKVDRIFQNRVLQLRST